MPSYSNTRMLSARRDRALRSDRLRDGTRTQNRWKTKGHSQSRPSHKKAPATCPGLSSSCRETPTLAKGGLPLTGRRRGQNNLIRRGRPRWVPASRAPHRAPAPPAGGLSEFPPPWAVEETDACFIVRNAHGQAPAYVYFEGEPRAGAAAHLLTCDDARSSPR
jgi:hypothetical protein